MIPRKRYDTNAELDKFYSYRSAFNLLLIYGKDAREMWKPTAGLTPAEVTEVWTYALKDSGV